MHNAIRETLKDAVIVISIVATVAGIVSIFLLHVKNEFHIAERGYDLADVTLTHRQLIEENRRLSVEAAMLMRTDHVIARAKHEFDLEVARPDQVILINENDTSESVIKTAMK